MGAFLHDLRINLISEAIGILVTVLLVDRVMQWRERSRWRQVRSGVLLAARSSCDDLLLAWQHWLVVADATDTSTVTDVVIVNTRRRGQILFKIRPYEEDVQHKLGLGQSVGSDASLLDFCRSCSQEDISNLKRSLRFYLRPRLSAPAPPIRAGLYEELTGPVTRLVALVQQFGGVVHADPGFAFPIIKMSVTLEHVKRWDGDGVLVKDPDDQWLSNVMVSMLIDALVDQVEAALRLEYYLRSQLKGETVEDLRFSLRSPLT